MTPIPVPHRWLAAILGIAFVLDGLLTVDAVGLTGQRDLLALPGSAALALCAYYGLTRPVAGALLGVVTLTLSTLFIRLDNTFVASIGLDHISLTEMVAGTVLTVLVIWRAPPSAAFGCTSALVITCLSAIILRDSRYSPSSDLRPYSGGTDLAMTAMLGLALLIASIATGIYLRRSGRQRIETPLSALIRNQWPLAAGLAVVGLVTESTVIGVLSGAIAGVCAFFAPRYPLRNALIASGAIGVISLFTQTQGSGTVFSFTGFAASMALIAYLVRLRPPRMAFLGTGALVVANVFALRIGTQTAMSDSTPLLFLLVLLGVAIVTGWYFRARDRERNQTVRAAVTSAQQGERMALARELHDVVAHHVTGIVVQAQAALLVAEKNPAVALTSLAKIERSGTEALTAMRTLVGGLRDGTAGYAAVSEATTDLRADLTSLVEHAVGPPVTLELDLPTAVPPEVGRSVLRLAQESLTNVGKHAPDATDVRLRVASVGDQLHIRVTDNGSARPVNPVGGSGGYGLVGMRERVELLGGRFVAGPSGYVGWSVEAWLPLGTYRGNE
ncbi:sensor histidine kinase [Actinophytocola sediminis]